jgi:hypothetical protein
VSGEVRDISPHGRPTPNDHFSAAAHCLTPSEECAYVKSPSTTDIDNLDVHRGHRTLFINRKGDKTAGVPLDPASHRIEQARNSWSSPPRFTDDQDLDGLPVAVHALESVSLD